MRRIGLIITSALLAVGIANTPAPAAERISPFPSIERVKGLPETTAWRLEPAVLTANTPADLDPVQRWADAITSQMPAILGDTQGSRAAYDRILESLFEWAGAEALADVRGEQARAILPRRLIGAVNAYLLVKPIADATQDIRKPAIERWIHQQARAARAIFGGEGELPGPGDERARSYNNNLQATAATLAMQAYLITGDASLREWSMTATRGVLDQIDAEGFTSEVRRRNGATAEYFAHETMIFLVATAGMANDNGDASLWRHRGAAAGASTEPALLRAGLLLGEDLGGNFVTKRHAARTTVPQQAYRRSYVVSPGPGGLLLPEGWLTCWMGPFLEQYDAAATTPGGGRLRAAMDYYRTRKISQFNGSVPLRATMIYPARRSRNALAQLE